MLDEKPREGGEEGLDHFLKYLIQPQVLNGLLKTGLGRNLPAMPAIVKNDPWWLDPKDPHRVTYVRQGLFGPTVPRNSRSRKPEPRPATRPLAQCFYRRAGRKRIGHGGREMAMCKPREIKAFRAGPWGRWLHHRQTSPGRIKVMLVWQVSLRSTSRTKSREDRHG